MNLKRYWTLAAFGLFHVFILMVLFQGAFPDEGEYEGFAEGDSRSLYFSYADKMLNGEFPYRDIDIEYTPGSLPLFLLPGLVSDGDLDYHVAFAIEMLVFDLLGLWLVYSLARRLAFPPEGALIICTIGLVMLGPTVIDHFDLVASIMVLLALYAFVRGWNTVSWVALALGTMIKVFPIVVAPILALYLLRQKRFRSAITGALAFGATVVAVSIPFLCIDAAAYIDSYAYHGERGLQVESTYASLLLLAESWGITSAESGFVEASGSVEVLTGTGDALARISPAIMVALLAGVYGLFVRRQWRGEQVPQVVDYRRLVNFSILAVVVFMLANKVFSPQYVIWLYPLIAVATGRWWSVTWMLYGAIGLMTMYIFSYHYDYIFPDHYVDLAYYHKTPMVYVLVIRNGLLVILAALLATASGWSPVQSKDVTQ